jgi:NitT/TauT family transport system substrate-binding protein
MQAQVRRLVRLGLVVCGLMAASVASAEPVKIRIGWSTMPGHLIPVLYSKPEILKHYGKSYVVEPVLFRGSSPQITAMAAGQIEMGAFSAQALALAATNAGMDVKVVADIIQDGVNGYHSDTFLVRNDSGINKPEDLKGKRIGTNAIGSASDTGMRVLLLNKGLVDKRDFTSIEVAFSNIPAMLDERKIDMGMVVQPFSDQLLKTGKYKVLYTIKDSVGPSELVFLAARGDFLKENRQALLDFFEDHVRAVRWFMDPKNKKEATEIIGKFMKQPPEAFEYLFTKADYYRDPYMVPNIDNIQSMVDASVKAGALQSPFKVAPDHVDLSFVEEAKRRIEATQAAAQ